MNKNILFSILIGTITIIISWILISNEIKRTELIPLTFSEIHEIEREQGTNLNATTKYYALMNDLLMKPLEAKNLSIGWNEDYKFASELEICIDPAFKIHKYNIPGILTNIDKITEDFLNENISLIGSDNLLKSAYENISSSWTKYQNDVYHTEYYEEEEEETDSEGHEHTVMVEKSRQVYDYTIYDYTFYPDKAEEGNELLASNLNLFPNILFKNIYSSKKTGAEGEYTTEKSWKNYKDITNNDNLTNLIRSWPDRTFYNKNKNYINNTYNSVKNEYENYVNSISTSHSWHYIRYSTFDSGPDEYQRSKMISSKLNNIVMLEDAILIPIENIKEKKDEYFAYMTNYINIKMDHKNGNPGELKDKIINTSKGWYCSLFDAEYINSYFNGWIIALVILICLISIGIIAFLNKEYFV